MGLGLVGYLNAGPLDTHCFFQQIADFKARAFLQMTKQLSTVVIPTIRRLQVIVIVTIEPGCRKFRSFGLCNYILVKITTKLVHFVGVLGGMQDWWLLLLLEL